MTFYEAPTLPKRDEKIPREVLDYFWRGMRHELHTQFLRAFQSQARDPEMQLTRAKLARRLGMDKGWVTKKLSAPNNMTLKTMSDFLVGMGIDPKPRFRLLFQDLPLDAPESSDEDDTASAVEAVRNTLPEENEMALPDEERSKAVVVRIAEWLAKNGGRGRRGPRSEPSQRPGAIDPSADILLAHR